MLFEAFAADSVDTLIGSTGCVSRRVTEKQPRNDRRLSHVVVVVVVVVVEIAPRRDCSPRSESIRVFRPTCSRG